MTNTTEAKPRLPIVAFCLGHMAVDWPHGAIWILAPTIAVAMELSPGDLGLLFAITAEPDNLDIKKKLERVRTIRANAAADWHDASPDEMTIPSTIGEERITNPFMRAEDSDELGRIRLAKDSF